MITFLILSQCYATFQPPLKCFHFCISLLPPAVFHCTLSAYLCPPSFPHFFSVSLPLLFMFPPYFFPCLLLLPMEIHLFLHLTPSLSLSLSVLPRAYLCVIWRMGLQHRGQGTWCSGCHCYGDLHHDAWPRATHPAKVKLPWDTWQKKLQHRPLQGNTQVSQWDAT